MFYHSPLPENFTNLGKSFSSFIQLCFFDNNLIKKKKKNRVDEKTEIQKALP